VERAERGTLSDHAWRTLRWLATDPPEEAIRYVLEAYEAGYAPSRSQSWRVSVTS
jgi:hypothetical protein